MFLTLDRIYILDYFHFQNNTSRKADDSLTIIDQNTNLNIIKHQISRPINSMISKNR